MNDRAEPPVETSEGHRGGSPVTDRLVVGLAALALLGGGLILLGRGLGDKNSASSSGSPESSSAVSSGRSSTPTPTLQPALGVVAIDSRPLPAPRPPEKAPFQGWIRLEVDLPIYQDVSTSASRIGTLSKGALTFAEDASFQGKQAGLYWLQIDNPKQVGFILAGNGNKLFVRRLVQSTSMAGYVSALTAGPEGFVALGSLSGRSDGSTDTPSQYLAASADGLSWKLAETTAFGGNMVQSVAWGPAGWLAVATVPFNQVEIAPWLWTSVDGRSWRSLGSFPIQGGTGQTPSRLLGSASGYLLIQGGDVSNPSAIAAWHSTDARTWTESRVAGDLSLTPETFVQTESGYYAWSDASGSGRSASAIYSSDGQNWVNVRPPPIRQNGRIVSVGDGLLAVDTSPVTGSPVVWTGSFSNGNLAWALEQASLPRGAAMTSLASSGRIAMLFGWDRATDEPRAWSRTGTNWSTVQLPRGAFGGTVPTTSVGGARGFVAVGSNLTLRADNPVLWSGTAVGEWKPEALPVVPQIGDPTRADCPPPADAVTLLLVDRPAAITCYGSSSLSFRLFDQGCHDRDCSSRSSEAYQPDWLANPSSNQLYMSPSGTQQWVDRVRRSASLREDPAWANHWVEITGHFDDPAARSCMWFPDPHAQETLYSAQAIVNACREEFVVTRVRVVSGP
jgi:hypothetical protein